MGQIPNCKFIAFDANGDQLSGGKVYFYEAGTSTPKDTYSDSGLVTANANPVVLNSRGEASIYGSGLYKIILKTSADETLWTEDNFRPTSITSLADTDNDTKVQCEESADEDIIRFDIGGTEQITLQDGKLEPTTDNDVDLGSSTKEFKNAYVDGTGYIDEVSGNDVLLDEQASAPTVGANQGGLFTKALDGQSELYYREESDGDEVLMTDQGRVPLPRAYLAGMGLVIGTDTAHDINIGAGVCRDSADGANLKLAATFVKQIDATWAAGSAAGGMFTGAVANATWYHVFVIRKDADGSIDGGFDTSVTAANIPTGYTEYRRLGAVLTDGSANILAFVQTGDYFAWVDPPLDHNAIIDDAARETLTLTVPLGVKVMATFNAASPGTVAHAYFSDLDINDEDPASQAAPLSNAGNVAAAEDFNQLNILTNAAKQIGARCSAGADAWYVSTVGWTDFRGRND